MAQPIEHRGSSRHPHEASILIENLPGGTYHQGKMINYSDKGMYFETNVAHPPGTTIIFGIENSPYEACQGVYRAEVKWCRKLPHDASMYYFGVGVEYAGPDTRKIRNLKAPAVEMRAPEPGDRSPAPTAAHEIADSQTGRRSEPQRELRKHPRKRYGKMVLYATTRRFYEGSIKDISNSGVFIETNDDLYVGQTLTLAIPAPKRRKEVKVKGEIVRIEPHGLGIKFKGIVKN
jgi:hypothetical protein